MSELHPKLGYKLQAKVLQFLTLEKELTFCLAEVLNAKI